MKKADIAALEATNPKTWWHPSYEEIVKDFGAEVLSTITLGSYQGDLLFLLKDGEQYGFLKIGYGSCSGCDELEACYDDVPKTQVLADEMFKEIIWKSKEEMATYLRERDPAKDYWMCEDEGRTARDTLLKIVEG